MLKECGCGENIVSDMKRGRMPSADKLCKISQYLGVNTDYLLGVTDNPIPPKTELSEEECLLVELFKLTPEDYEQAKQYVEFLKTRRDFKQEFSAMLDTNTVKPQHK